MRQAFSDALDMTACRYAITLTMPPATPCVLVTAGRYARSITTDGTGTADYFVYARSSAAVLIEGETGTGKEWRPRRFIGNILPATMRDRAKVASVCCRQLRGDCRIAAGSKLFGYEEGAFTGSRRGGRAGCSKSPTVARCFLTR